MKVSKDENITPAQVLISWSLQRGTVPLVKSGHVNRLAENYSVVELSKESMGQINCIQTRHRYIDSASWTGHNVFEE
jgi:diketogulonate reductase-like aldo/keto reductase